MKKGNKKSSIIDRAKSNMEENRKKQKLQKICKKRAAGLSYPAATSHKNR